MTNKVNEVGSFLETFFKQKITLDNIDSLTESIYEKTNIQIKELSKIIKLLEFYKEYLKNEYGISEFKIIEKEKGNIPMTCYDFEAKNTECIIHIGTIDSWKACSADSFTECCGGSPDKKCIRISKW